MLAGKEWNVTVPPTTRGPSRRLLRLAALGLVATAMLLPRQAPGTVAEQRARLPPPATCEHDVEGYWKSHAYNPMFRDWVEFTLEVRTVPAKPGELTGRIVNHTWEGGPEREQPGPCGPQQSWRARIGMQAKGTYTGRDITFWGTEWKLDEVVGWGYNLDRFTGTIDPAIQEFQSVNNDGGRSVNEPTVFRRIGCFDSAPPPSVEVKPPAVFPARRKGGCSCSFG
jgi:hypothetical protein